MITLRRPRRSSNPRHEHVATRTSNYRADIAKNYRFDRKSIVGKLYSHRYVHLGTMGTTHEWITDAPPRDRMKTSKGSRSRVFRDGKRPSTSSVDLRRSIRGLGRIVSSGTNRRDTNSITRSSARESMCHDDRPITSRCSMTGYPKRARALYYEDIGARVVRLENRLSSVRSIGQQYTKANTAAYRGASRSSGSSNNSSSTSTSSTSNRAA